MSISSFLQTIAFVVKWDRTDFVFYIKESIVDFLFVGVYYHLWFVLVLIYTMLFFCLIHKLVGEKGLFTMEIVCVVAGLAILGIDINISGVPDFLIKFITNFAKASMGFSIGGIASQVINKKKSRLFINVSAVIIVVCYIVNKIINIKILSSAVNNLRFDTYVLLAILLAQKYPINVKKTWLVDWMAPASRFSYYSHDLFLQVYKSVLVLAPFQLQSTILFVMTVATTTGITMLLHRNKSRIVQKFFE